MAALMMSEERLKFTACLRALRGLYACFAHASPILAPFHPRPPPIVNNSSLDIDPQRVRRLFARPTGNADFILREISGRMFDRLDYIKLEAQRVLDAGCGSGADLELLARRFPAAQVLGLDVVPGRLPHQRATPGLAGMLQKIWSNVARQVAPRRSAAAVLAADYGALPLANGTLDLIWSNLALHWHAAPHTVLPEWRRALKVNGLVLFSAFGPDTLKEVRAAFAAADPGAPPAAHVASFTDLHDFGDMLVAAGFATPVMDAERLTLTYADAASLWADVRVLGGNASLHRRRGLMGRVARRRLDAALAASRDDSGRYRLSFEVVYGHAWNPPLRTLADGSAIIRFERNKRSG